MCAKWHKLYKKSVLGNILLRIIKIIDFSKRLWYNVMMIFKEK